MRSFILGLLGLAATAAAHWVSPEDVVRELNVPALRDSLGIVNAARDERTPRLLIVRVGDRWYALSGSLRRAQAEQWRAVWRHNVAQGIVAVLDDRSERSVVRFGRDGRVATLAARAPAATR